MHLMPKLKYHRCTCTCQVYLPKVTSYLGMGRFRNVVMDFEMGADSENIALVHRCLQDEKVEGVLSSYLPRSSAGKETR